MDIAHGEILIELHIDMMMEPTEYSLKNVRPYLVMLALTSLLSLGVSRCGEQPAQGPVTDSLYHMVGGTHDTMVAVTFQNVRECVKCQIYLTQAMECLRKKFGSHMPIRLVCAVACQRPIELRAFQRENDMFDALVMDDGTLKSSLGLPLDTRLAVIDTDRRIIGLLRQRGYETNACVEWDEVPARR